MFSTITMASSTTSPTLNTIDNSVNRLREKPKTCMMNRAATSDSGIATTGINPERLNPRNKKITRMIINRVSDSVLITSTMAASIYLVASYATTPLNPVGSSARIASISAVTAFMTSSELALGATKTPIKTACASEQITTSL